jgi:dihydrofolate reductase
LRTVIASTFIRLDGVMQAPDGPEEDPSGGFRFGGWIPPYWDEALGAAIGEVLAQPYDLLLGRRTYDIFAAHWPHIDVDPSSSTFDELNAGIANTFNAATKYVATHRPESLTWQNSQPLGEDVIGRLRELKREQGPNLLIQGSSELIHQLLAAGLIDRMTLLTFPVVLGKGKRLFGDGAVPAAFKLVKSSVAPSGALIATYERAGEVRTGSFAMETPSEAELERRRSLR